AGGGGVGPARAVVVLVDGAGQDVTNWQLPARWFAWHGDAALAVDLPGHGRSEGPPLATVPELAAWIGRLLMAAGCDRVALVGHSLGGAIALEAAAALGPGGQRLAVLATAPALPRDGGLLAAAARDHPGKAHQLITSWALSGDAKLGGTAQPGLSLTGLSLALLARNRPGVLSADLTACQRWDSGPAAARRVACPSLLVIGG